jgi:predicted signal transduction protein with EAL and GGDEF domain
MRASIADDDGPDNLLRNADLATYRAKATRRGRHVVFDATMQRGVVERLDHSAPLALVP